MAHETIIEDGIDILGVGAVMGGGGMATTPPGSSPGSQLPTSGSAPSMC